MTTLPPPSVPGGAPLGTLSRDFLSISPRLPSVRDLVSQDYGEEIRAAAAHATQISSTPNSPNTYLLKWNNALSAKVNSLSAEELQQYQNSIDKEDIRWKSAPSKEEVLV